MDTYKGPLLVCSGIAGLIGGGLLLWRWWKKRTSYNQYEQEECVNEYMAFHYTSPSDYIAFSFGPKDALDFPARCVELCKKHKSDALPLRALDVGCAVGRSTFELATAFDEVIGIDLSQAFINKANQLKQDGHSSYRLLIEGDLYMDMEARIDSSIVQRGPKKVKRSNKKHFKMKEDVRMTFPKNERNKDRQRVNFRVGDACSLPHDIGQFGMVLAANLICRLPNPRAFLDQLKDLVLPAGIVVITSPYTWLQEYTPKDHWLGGYINEGVRIRGFDALKHVLSPHFILLEEEQLPFIIRETLRKHQWTVAHATVWMRKID